MTIHIARRSFKAGGIFYPAGTLFDDVTQIKLYKIRINEGIIREVPEDRSSEAFERLRDYFEIRYNVDLVKVLDDRASKGSDIAEAVTNSVNAIPTPPGTIEDTDTSTNTDTDTEEVIDIDVTVVTDVIIEEEDIVNLIDRAEEGTEQFPATDDLPPEA